MKQVPSFKRDFLKYRTFRNVKTENIIPDREADRYILKQALTFASALVMAHDGKFVISPLPVEAQMFPIHAFEDGDFNSDGHADIVAVGNLTAVQPDLGRYDAGYGLILLGDGGGNFNPLPIKTSGFLVRGEGRDLRLLKSATGSDLLLVARNNDSTLLFSKAR